MLLCLFEGAVVAGDVPNADWFNPPAVVLQGGCAIGADASGRCSCLAAAAGRLKPQLIDAPTPQAAFVAGLCVVWAGAEAQRLAQVAWLRRLVVGAVQALTKGMEARGAIDPLSIEVDDIVLMAPSGKRRLDDDLQFRASTAVHRDGLAGTTGAWVRAHRLAPSSSVGNWDQKFLAQYPAAMMLTLDEAQLVDIAFDCGRFGNPAEETLVMSLWSADKQSAGWLPCQAM